MTGPVARRGDKDAATIPARLAYDAPLAMFMDARAALANLRTVASKAIARRGAWSGGLSLVERVVTPLVAWTLVQRTLVEKAAVTLAFSALFVVRTLLQHVAAARAEGELLERVAGSVLDGDVLRGEVLPDEDLRLEAAQGVYLVAAIVSRSVPAAAADAVACVILSVALVVIEPLRLVAAAGAVTLASATALLILRRGVARGAKETWRRQRLAYEAFGDALEGRLEIVAAGRRGAFMTDLRSRVGAWGDQGVRLALESTLAGRLAFVGVAGTVATALMAADVRGSLSISLADLAIFASVAPAFAGLAQAAHTLARDGHWVRLLARAFQLPAEYDDRARRPASGAGPRQPLGGAPDGREAIAFEGVSFAYGAPAKPGNPTSAGARAPRLALNGVTFAWSRREVLALSGANGSGKSTCLRLLLALGSPAEGAVRIDGVALDAIDADAWRARVAFLPQRPYMPPHADVRLAVQWPLSRASDDDIARALDRVGLLPALRASSGDPLACRVDTLSVGQRQRVALARLICRDASLFLLDEPDANLDRAGIELVAQLVRELAGRGMVAFAAHTPELLRVADRVVSLEEGRVVAPA